MSDTEETLEIDPSADYPWSKDSDEQRRAFVFEAMANPEIDVTILLANMSACVKWLTDGALPAPVKPRLRAVSKE